MKKKKRKLSVLMAALCSAAMLVPGQVNSGVNKAYGADAEKVKIEYQEQDLNEIPDRFNTGPKGKLDYFTPVLDTKTNYYTVTAKNSKNEDVKLYLKLSGDEVTYYIDFSNAENKKLSGEIVLSNINFYNTNIRTKEEDKLVNNITLVFKNCRFEYVRTLYPDSKFKAKFYNCSFYNFNGSNSYFERCAFGGKPNDALNPFRNVEVKSCYFSDMNYYLGKETHIDGTQIYAYAEVIRDAEGEPILDADGKRQYKNPLDATNINFDNCRYEIPNIVFQPREEEVVEETYEDELSEESSEKKEDEKPKVATINACLMVQLEYARGYDIHFKNCILNGGGYSIYSHAVKNGSLDNVSFENIKVGRGRSFGVIYPDIDPDTKIKNLNATDSLYVGSVFKDGDILKLSVTNDTGVERIIKIVTDKSVTVSSIKAGPTASTLNTPGYEAFADMPFDKLVQVQGDCKYAVCFDVTDPNNIKQIRFYNETDEDVYLDKSYFSDSNVIFSGDCGDKNSDIKFTLTNDYVLTISGTGYMQNYHSELLPPWWEYRDYIKKVVIEDGVKSVGGFSFWDCFALEEVVLADSVEVINGKAFKNCITLTEINIGENVEVKNEAFIGAFMYGLPKEEIVENPENENKNSDNTKKDSLSENTDKNKDAVKVGSILKDKKYIYKVTKSDEVKVIGLKKKSLKEIKIATKVTIGGVTYKVTSIGANAFKGNKKIKKVTIGKNVKTIGANAFAKCKLLKKVRINSKKIKKIGKKAFYKKGGKKIKIKVPKSKKKAYKKLLKRAKCKSVIVK